MTQTHLLVEKLRKVLSQEDTVLFVGSGISLWSGLPTWAGLIDTLATVIEENGSDASLVRTEKEKGDLLQAASYGFNKLSKHQVGDFIRRVCHYGTAKPHDIHRRIVTLGPRCFITTNYDDLIEQSLRIWQPDRFYRSAITNRHLTETAEIVHARAIDYIFKPHGDAGDIESIVLTREQYRKLMPQGERYSALETLKMIMTTRPIVYLGFGLRDPDFVYIRDLLANTFSGGTRDHFALMADVSQEESNYWKDTYGIHLINYDTFEGINKHRDHSQLLKLLDDLNVKNVENGEGVFDPCSNKVILSLARYAAGLRRINKLNSEFEIRVHFKPINRHLHVEKGDQFNGIPIDQFLIDGPKRALVIGLPGAGKTYSLTKSVSAYGDELSNKCLAEQFDITDIVVPVFVDMKLYQGKIKNLINSSLPVDLPFDKLVKNYKLKIFIDSFNEMPREYWENGLYENDFEEFTNEVRECSIIIGSRTNDGLNKLDLPTYNLDQISRKDIFKELDLHKIKFEGIFLEEIILLLQRPFFFHYITSKKVILSDYPHPRDFYKSFFNRVNNGFFERFNVNYCVDFPLSLAAYETLNRGEEAFPLTELTRILRTDLQKNSITLDVKEVTNWLVSYSVLIPYTNGRISFIHQTITEYLAAKELAHQYDMNSYILQEKLALKRWDQTLLLTLSMLPLEKANDFTNEIVRIDFTLALNATKYLEFDRDRIISLLLEQIPNEVTRNSHVDNWQIANAISRNLNTNRNHENQLWEIVKIKDTIGGAAAECIIQIRGEEVKKEMIELIFKNPKDYNFCSSIGKALQAFATQSDLDKIVTIADELYLKFLEVSSGTVNEALGGFINGISNFLNDIEVVLLRKAFIPLSVSSITPLRAQILCRILWNNTSLEHLKLASDLLMYDVDGVTFAIYLIASTATRKKINLDLGWKSFSTKHVDKLISQLSNKFDEGIIDALYYICSERPDLADYTRQIATQKSRIERIALLRCLSENNSDTIFQLFSDLIVLSADDRRALPINILKSIEVDWEGKGDLFVQLLKTRDIEILSLISGNSIPAYPENLPEINIGPIEWWLNWIHEISTQNKAAWNARLLGSIIATYSNEIVRQNFIDEFNNEDFLYRRVIQHFILPYVKDLSTDNFSDKTISYLFADLTRANSEDAFYGHLLGITATESFVTDKLLPLLTNADEEFLHNIRKVLSQAGSRHNRRYF